VAGDTEVKAQIRLQFRDITGQKCMVIRSLLATQKVFFHLSSWCCIACASTLLMSLVTLNEMAIIKYSTFELHGQLLPDFVLFL